MEPVDPRAVAGGCWCLVSRGDAVQASDSLQFLAAQDPSVVFDLVWLDDVHAASHVLEELQALAPHLHSDSLVLMHDTMAVTKPFYNYDLPEQPAAVLKELDPFKWEYATFPTCHGLTVLRPASAA